MFFLAQVANADLFYQGALFSSSKTLLDSSITIGVTADDVRAGQGAKLYAKNFHSSVFTVKLSDQMFKIDYIAKNIGSSVVVGGEAITTESVTLAAGGVGTVTGTPVAFGSYGVVGWATLSGTDAYTQYAFTGSTFTVPGGATGAVYCVKYFALDSAGKLLTVSANIIPKVVTAVLTANLFDGDPNQISASQKVGKVTIRIDKLQLDGAQELTMSMTGVSQTDISGTALVSNEACGDGYYATILQTEYNANWYDDATMLSIEDGDFALVVPATRALRVFAIYPNAEPLLVANSALTFVSETLAVATVASTGIVTSVGAGTSAIRVKITAKPSVECVAFVTVTI